MPLTSSSRMTVTWSYEIRRPLTTADGHRWKRPLEVQHSKLDSCIATNDQSSKKRTRLRTAASGGERAV
ncbi:MAG: hypothetical protein QOF66_811 [Mycobacterium sp.]|nr:hypothetical protein [Mycobacterium sp.]